VRNEMTASRSNLRVLLAAGMAVFACGPSYAQCVVPTHHNGQVWENSASTVMRAVSLQLQDFSPAKAVCLAAALKARYHDQKSIKILIFSSLDAAWHYSGDIDAADSVAASRNARTGVVKRVVGFPEQLHAIYSYDAKKSEEYIMLKPFGLLEVQPEDTRIDLPAATLPPCRLAIRGRCVVELDRVAFPNEFAPPERSVTVTLTGTITRSGKMTGVKVVEATSVPSQTTAPFVAEAVGNLKTWRLEQSANVNTIRISYRYILDFSVLEPGQSEVRFGLPSRITIRARPY
jgi:hypothetical protein